MKKIFIFVALSLFTFGCASIENANDAEFVDANGQTKSSRDHAMGGVTVTYEVDHTLTDKNFKVVQMTFTNTTQEWVRVKNVKIDFGTEDLNKTVLITGGQDLVAWSEAVQQKQAVANYNASLFIGSVALVGAAAASTSSNSRTQAIGAGAMLGALTVGGVRDLKQKLNSLEFAQLYPNTHLLAGDINVPPGLFQKKWIVLNSKSPLTSLRVNALTSAEQKIDFIMKL